MKGITVRGDDKDLTHRARAAGLGVADDGWSTAIPFAKTLIVTAGTRVPWDLLPHAWHFLERWDAAVPLWRYGITAADVGTSGERAKTKAVVGDLRVLLHSTELLFVRQNEAGQALVAAWRQEMAPAEAGEGEERLAFLRALHLAKPRVCVLPISWVAAVRQMAQQDVIRARRNQERVRETRPLVTVTVAPGRLVKCYAGDEERVLAHYERQQKGRMRNGAH